jgi:hypothetical protein
VTKSNKVMAAGLLAAFAQLAVAQPAYAEEQASQPQAQEESQAQQPQAEQDGLIGLMIEFYDRLFDSQNN